jgi:cytochrome c553
MKTHSLGALAILLCIASAAPVLAADAGVAPELLAACESCHGPGGNSARRDVPRLNGQKADYIVLRLNELGDPSRNTPHAAPMTKFGALKDADAAALARYFSSRPPSQPSGFRTEASAGENLFRHGNSEANIPACSACHGLGGEGYGAYPRLAGQRELYLRQQLQAFQARGRASTEMNRHAWDLTQQQILDILAYLANG